MNKILHIIILSQCHSLETAIKMGWCSRHYGLNEEGLLATALLIPPDDTEAPALTVGLHQHDITTPVHVACV